MKRFFYLLTLAAAASIIVSCATVTIEERTNDKAALVYGYINMQQQSQSVNWMSALQFTPPTEKPYWSLAIKDGYFFNEKFVPGTYCINSFGTDSRTFKLSYEVGCFEIEKSDLYFFGSYEMVWREGESPSLKRAHNPGEADVIEMILQSTDKGTYWEDKLKKRLAILRQAEMRKSKIPRAPAIQ